MKSDNLQEVFDAYDVADEAYQKAQRDRWEAKMNLTEYVMREGLLDCLDVNVRRVRSHLHRR